MQASHRNTPRFFKNTLFQMTTISTRPRRWPYGRDSYAGYAQRSKRLIDRVCPINDESVEPRSRYLLRDIANKKPFGLR
jgi:hypothetical protein